jgi:hypothetical protein
LHRFEQGQQAREQRDRRGRTTSDMQIDGDHVGVGHTPMVETPAKTLELIEGFLSAAR